MAPRVVGPLLLALGIVLAGSAVAFADEGSPRVASAAGPVRPEETILRLVAQAKRQLVLFVGGFASDLRDASPFAALAARFPEYEVAYFGADRDGAYDSLAGIGGSGGSGGTLRDAVRRKVRRDDFEKVHVVAHSMGGNVSDAAFEAGLGRRDNVASYTAIDSPHRGSAVARATRVELAAALIARPEARDLVRFLSRPVTPLPVSGEERAVVDLARRRDPSAPAGVRTIVVAVTNSELVGSAESRLDGAERWSLPVAPLRRDHGRWGFGAHGLVLEDSLAQAIVEANVRDVRVAPPPHVRALGEGLGFVVDVGRFAALAVGARVFRTLTWTLFGFRAMSGSTRWAAR